MIKGRLEVEIPYKISEAKVVLFPNDPADNLIMMYLIIEKRMVHGADFHMIFIDTREPY